MIVLSNKDFIIVDSFDKEQIDTFKYLSMPENAETVLVEVSIYDSNSNVLLNNSIVRYSELLSNLCIIVSINDRTITIYTDKILKYFNFFDGTYTVKYKFHNNILGTKEDDNRMFIQKISPSRKEIFVSYINKDAEQDFINFSHDHFYVFSQQIILNKFINFSNDKTILALNAKNQKDGDANVLIIKLYEALPREISVKDTFWVIEAILDFLEESVVIHEQIDIDSKNYNILKGPKYSLSENNINLTPTKYKSYYDLVETSSVGEEYFADSLTKDYFNGINLNIEYNDFPNFVHFGSALQMVDNFRNKLATLEYYISQLNTVSNMPSQSGTIESSSIFLKSKKQDIISNFTRYERFLYFESGSYFSSSLYPDSYGSASYIDATWPKSGPKFAYTLYSATSSVADNWYATMSNVAYMYDLQNDDRLLQSMPEYIKSDADNNSDYIKFVNMTGEFYDNIWLYVSNFTRTFKRENKFEDGVPSDLIWDVLKNYGLNLNNGLDLIDLSRYKYGYYISSSTVTELDSEEKDITKQIWNRILNNYPYIFKSKGTKKSIISTLNCYGIPQSLIRIQEFGGPYSTGSISGSKQYSYEYQDFTHVLEMTGNEYIDIPWTTSSYDSMKPDSIEFKFRTSETTLPTLDLFSLSGSSGQVKLTLNKSYDEFAKLSLNVNGTILTSSVKPFYNNEFYSVLVKRTTETDDAATDQSYHLQVKSFDQYINKIVIEEDIVRTVTSSNAYVNATHLYFGGSPGSINKFVGAFDEIRLWSEITENDTFDYHAKYSLATNGNELTSSLSTLAFRLSFNNPYNLGATSSMPNEAFNTSSYMPTASAFGFTSIASYPYNFSDFERSNLIENRFVFADMQNQKVRIERNYISQHYDSGSLRLYPLRGNYILDGYEIEGEKSEFDNLPVDTDTLLIGFTPVDFTNNDILAFYGNNDILGTYGDYNNLYEDYYPSSEHLNDLYYENSRNTVTFEDYINYIKTYDKSLFDIIRQLVPAKSTLIMGTVYEQTILRRNRVKLMDKEIAINYREYKFPVSGKVERGKAEANDLYIDSMIDSTKKLIKFPEQFLDIFDSSINTEKLFEIPNDFYDVFDGTVTIIQDVINLFGEDISDALDTGEGIINYKINKYGLYFYLDGYVNRQRDVPDRFRTYCNSTKNSSLTTPDRKPAVIITATNPKKLKVNYSDSPKLRVVD